VNEGRSRSREIDEGVEWTKGRRTAVRPAKYEAFVA
jgi:hypothetical protein